MRVAVISLILAGVVCLRLPRFGSDIVMNAGGLDINLRRYRVGICELLLRRQ
jgi:hypothetical protein